MYIYMYTYMYRYMYVYVHIYVYIYKHIDFWKITSKQQVLNLTCALLQYTYICICVLHIFIHSYVYI